MKTRLILGAFFLLAILSIGLFIGCDLEGESTTLRGIYFTIDTAELNVDYDYYFIGYNATTGGNYSSSHSVMETATPGLFFTEDILNLGNWIWSIYEVSSDYPNLVSLDNHDKLVQGEGLPQTDGLHRCQINILITLTQDDVAEHKVILQDCGGILGLP